MRARAQGPFGLDPNARASRFADAIPEYEIMLSANPNNVGALAHLGWCRIMTGAGDEGIPLLAKATRLSPRDPYLYLWSMRIGFAHLFQSPIDEAIIWFDKARRANPKFASPHWLLASAYGLKDELGRAAAELGEALRLSNLDRSTVARLRANADWNTPALHEPFEDIFLAGLRKAGLPEE